MQSLPHCVYICPRTWLQTVFTNANTNYTSCRKRTQLSNKPFPCSLQETKHLKNVYFYHSLPTSCSEHHRWHPCNYVNFSRLAKNKRIKTRIRPQLTHWAKCNVHKMGKKYLKFCTTEKGAALQEVASDAN